MALIFLLHALQAGRGRYYVAGLPLLNKHIIAQAPSLSDCNVFSGTLNTTILYNTCNPLPYTRQPIAQLST